jgi:hypothetical protein
MVREKAEEKEGKFEEEKIKTDSTEEKKRVWAPVF